MAFSAKHCFDNEIKEEIKIQGSFAFECIMILHDMQHNRTVAWYLSAHEWCVNKQTKKNNQEEQVKSRCPCIPFNCCSFQATSSCYYSLEAFVNFHCESWTLKGTLKGKMADSHVMVVITEWWPTPFPSFLSFLCDLSEHTFIITRVSKCVV